MARARYIGDLALKQLCVVAVLRCYVFNLYPCPITEDIETLDMTSEKLLHS